MFSEFSIPWDAAPDLLVHRLLFPFWKINQSGIFLDIRDNAEKQSWHNVLNLTQAQSTSLAMKIWLRLCRVSPRPI